MAYTPYPGFGSPSGRTQGYEVQDGRPVFGSYDPTRGFVPGATALTPEIRARIAQSLSAGGGGESGDMGFLDPEAIFGPQSLTTTSVSDLPDWLKVYVQDYLGKAKTLSNQPATKVIAPFTDAEKWGQALGLSRAKGDQAFIEPLNAEALKTLRGDYLRPETNPYLRDTYNLAAEDVTRNFRNATAPSLQAYFNRAGAFGGSAYEEAMQDAYHGMNEDLNRLAVDIYGGNYNAERGRQYGEQNMIPGVIQAGQLGPDIAQNIGSKQRAYDQQLRMWPYQANEFYGSAIANARPGFGSVTGTAPNPAYQSPFANLLSLGSWNSQPGFGLGFGGFGG